MEADPKVMHSEVRFQLVQRLLAPDRLDHHPRLELGTVLFPRRRALAGTKTADLTHRRSALRLLSGGLSSNRDYLRSRPHEKAEG